MSGLTESVSASSYEASDRATTDFIRPGRQRDRRWLRFTGVALLNLVASIHLIWFYVSCVHSYLHLEQFEQGLEKTPFQYRLLMMFPLRWAHQSPWLIELAHRLTGWSAWFPNGMRPEGLVEAPIDLACVVITGLVARSIYRASSKTGVLTAYVYPLTLLMVATTYAFYTMHRLRFVYDLPSMGFFAGGIYLLYFRRSRFLFAILFIIATVNRETTLFLLLLYILTYSLPAPDAARPSEPTPSFWRYLLKPSTWTVVAPLLMFWILWHLWLGRHFAHNIDESWSRVWLNVGILLWPTSWAQILSMFAFCGPLVLLGGRLVDDPVLRRWQWILPVWFLFMFRYGILVETRIFGELIPYMACMAALIAEQQILRNFVSETLSDDVDSSPLGIVR